ncbi:hypothetical protein [Ensifer adhaerens]
MKISEMIARLEEAKETQGDATLVMHDFVVERVEVNPINDDEFELGVVVKVD